MPNVNYPDTLTHVESGDFALPVQDMPPATVAYLLANGYSQSMTDARTTAQARAIEAFAKATKATKAEVDAWKESEAGKAEITQAGLDAMQKRHNALTEGSMVYGARGPNGPRKSPLEDFIWRTAESEFRAILRGKNIAWPKEREKIEPALTAYIDAHRKRLESDFKKRTSATDGGMDSILAMLG